LLHALAGLQFLLQLASELECTSSLSAGIEGKKLLASEDNFSFCIECSSFVLYWYGRSA